MPEFSYEALATTGQTNRGTLTALTEQEAVSMLDARGLFPLKIEPVKAVTVGPLGSRRIPARQMATFYSQLADLLHSGVALLRSLDILERQCATPALSQIVRDVRAKVADGTSLADSMVVHPGAFTELAVSMIRAGQEGGFLEDVLRRIADFTENQEDLKAKVVGALAYPLFLLVVGLLVLNVLVIFFVPQFEPIFERLREKDGLPFLTQMLISTSHFMQSYWWVVLGGLIFGYLAFRNWARTESGRYTIDSWRLKFPVAGTIYLNLALSRFTRIQGTLLQNGIPLLQALRIAKDSTGNKVLTEAIENAAANVTEGNSLAAPLQACPYFPRDVVEMVAVGEESNSLERVLLDIANGLERRTSRQLDLFVRLLEPIMLLVMAAFTLVVVAGLMLPVFKMSSTVQ